MHSAVDPNLCAMRCEHDLGTEMAVEAEALDNEEFTVVDAKTDEDLTRSILLQIILEEEANGSPMFSSEPPYSSSR